MISILFFFILSQSDMPVTRWVGPGEPTKYNEWIINKNTSEKVSIGEVFSSNIKGDSLIEVIVETDLYPLIETNLQILVNDFMNEGYSVDIDTVSSTQTIQACDSIRNFLYNKIAQGLKGVFFIGDVPIVWYQMIDDFGGGPGGYEEFPCDLYFMDLDGIWTDDSIYNGSLIPGSDGIFDCHTGDVSLEIWATRLYFSSLGKEDELTNSYLKKSHLYKTDSLSAVCRGLIFDDDDWAPWANIYTADLMAAYSNVSTVFHPESTRASNYISCLQDNYEWVGLYCHSSPTNHSFKINNGTGWDDLYSTQIPTIIPQGLFYNLFCCSNVRYIENNYMGGSYIVNSPKGLGSIGTTKTGSMFDFFYFYNPLGNNNCIGDAFLSWFNHIAIGGFDIIEKSWFYGMTFIGDPTLLISTPSPFLYSNSIIIEDSQGNNDGRLYPGETAKIRFQIINHYAATDAYNVIGELYTEDNSINISTATTSFGNINPGDSIINSTPFVVSVNSQVSPHLAIFVLFIKDNQTGKVFQDSFNIQIGRELVLIVDDDNLGISQQTCINSLENLNIDFEVLGRDTSNFTNTELNQYDLIIWITGAATNTLTLDDQSLIENYFNNNGKLLLYGKNIAEDLQGSSFLQNFLKVQYGGNTSEYYQNGIDNDPIGDSLRIIINSQTSQDMLIPLAGAEKSFVHNNTTDSASIIRIEGMGKIVFGGFDFQGISSSVPGFAPVDTIFSRIIHYLYPSVQVEEEIANNHNNQLLSIERINISNSGINFSINCFINSKLKAEIYNVSGRRVKTIFNNIVNQNTLNVFWDKTDNNGNMIAQGIYFIIISSDNNIISSKISIIE